MSTIIRSGDPRSSPDHGPSVQLASFSPRVEDSKPPSFADIIRSLEADAELPPTKRRDMISALRSAAQLFGITPEAVFAHPRLLRKHFDAASAASGGFGKRRWANMRSLVLAAMRREGIAVMPGRSTVPLSPAWQSLQDCLPDKRHRTRLSRFCSFCSKEGVSPETVGEATFTAFAFAVLESSFVRKGAAMVGRSRALWNSAADLISEWPAAAAVRLPPNPRFYALEWNAFPASLQADADSFLDRLGNQNPFADDYAPSVRPSTVKVRRMQILQIASALTHAGHPASAITDLAALVQVPNAKLALGYLFDRAGRKPKKFLHQQARLLKTIARYWAKLPLEELEELSRLCGRLAVRDTGMVEKNRVRLRQFDNPANVIALLNLPRQVLAKIRTRDDGGRKTALRAMKAIAVEILVAAPIRADNLAGLEIGRNLIRVRAGGISRVYLVLSPEETKNHAPYEMQLSPETDRVLQLYQDRYHGRLSREVSTWLFPNPAGQRRSTVNFAQLVCRFVENETGIKMNLHLFRHTAVKLHLDAHPDDIETARRLLGHKSIQTTISAYAEASSAAAFRRYDEVIGNIRETAQPPARRKTISGKRS